MRTDLDRLLDQHTPLYKSRFESLSAQAQQIVDALAIHWHPITAADLSAGVRLPVNAVSAQLDRLVRQGLVEKVAYYEPESRAGFQIAERFFNIWYLMRASRRVRRKLIWLVEFLRLYHGPAGLRQRAQRYLHDEPPADSGLRLQHAEYGLALSEAIQEAPLRVALESSSVRALLSDSTLRSRIHDLLDLDGGDTALRDRAEAIQDLERCRERIFAAKVSWSEWDPERFWQDLGGSISLSAKEKADMAAKLDTLSEQQLAGLLSIFTEEQVQILRDFWQCYRDRAASARPSRRLHDGPGRFRRCDGGCRTSRTDRTSGHRVGNASRKGIGSQLLDYLEAALPAATCPYPHWRWAEEAAPRWQATGSGPSGVRTSHTVGCQATRSLGLLSENCTPTSWSVTRTPRRPTARPSNSIPSRLSLERSGHVRVKLERYAEAEAAYRKAIELDPKTPRPWNGLGNLYADKLERYADAEAAYRKAIELDPKYAHPWNGLGNLYADKLERYADAEAAYRKAIELDPKFAPPWNNLGNLYQDKLKRYADAEAAYRKAIELDPKDAYPWNGLGKLYKDKLERYADAEPAYRKVVELEPSNGENWNNLAWFLFSQNADLAEAEQAAWKAVEFAPGNLYAAHTLATILVRRGRWEDATSQARRFLTEGSEGFQRRTGTTSSRSSAKRSPPNTRARRSRCWMNWGSANGGCRCARHWPRPRRVRPSTCAAWPEVRHPPRRSWLSCKAKVPPAAHGRQGKASGHQNPAAAKLGGRKKKSPLATGNPA